MVRLVVINLTPVSVTATQCNPQDLSVFSQAQPFGHMHFSHIVPLRNPASVER